MKRKLLFVATIICCNLLTGCETRKYILENKKIVEEYVQKTLSDMGIFEETNISVDDNYETIIKLYNVDNWTMCANRSKKISKKLKKDLKNNVNLKKIYYECAESENNNANSYVEILDIRKINLDNYNEEIICLDKSKNKINESFDEAYARYKKEYVSKCEEYNYKDVLKYSEKYVGKYAKFVGKIIQITKENGYYLLAINVTKSAGTYVDTVIISLPTISSNTIILEDDIIIAYGKMDGLYEYELKSGSIAKLPHLNAEYVDEYTDENVTQVEKKNNTKENNSSKKNSKDSNINKNTSKNNNSNINKNTSKNNNPNNESPNHETSTKENKENGSNLNSGNKLQEEKKESNNQSNISVSKQNALKKAKSYLDYSAFSRNGLIKQLKFEGFSNEDAVYAVDNINADWNEQSLKKAKSYLDYSAFSKKGLIKQLEYEGFTSEQANYGVSNCGADWNAQSLKKAKSYLDYSAFSKKGLIKQLEYEGFTSEQANYGANNCGADWNVQATKKAKSYLEHSSFSRNELIKQLEYEGFTSEQALYGVTQNGL